MRRLLSRLPVLRVALLDVVVFALLGDAICLGDGQVDTSTSTSTSQSLYLRTEFLPYKKMVERELPYRLGREIVRQAILIAARDELGLTTFDETLRETVSESRNVVPLMCVERASALGKWNVKLIPHAADADGWEKTYDYVARGPRMYADMIPKLEADSRSEFCEALRAVGLDGQKPPLGEPAPPDETIEQLLAQVDFITQYGAVRAAHRAIRACGETPEWLSVLVRGYANLALLTRHQWNSSTEVFTARSWLYAQRMVVAESESDWALWHRAYAWALGGALHHAMEDVELIQGRHSESDQKSDGRLAEPPPWALLVQPYCEFDRAGLRQLEETLAAIRPWALRLRFALASFYAQDQRMYRTALEITDVCPTAYGVYADLAARTFPRVSSSGMAWGPLLFAHHLAPSLSQVADLPESIQELLADGDSQPGLPDNFPGAIQPPITFSPQPASLARRLRQESRQADSEDPSWSVLAFLLEEEQAAQIVRYVIDRGVATKSSGELKKELAKEVDVLLPLVQDHPYAFCIECFRYDAALEEGNRRYFRVLESVEIRDPRMNMYPLFRLLWRAGPDFSNGTGRQAYTHAHRNFTLPGMLEHLDLPRRTARPEERFAKMYVREMRAIAPHSECGVYLELLWAQEPQPDELAAWEAQLQEDPRALGLLANRYRDAGDFESAIRCWQKSLSAEPTVWAAVELAQIFRERGAWEKWEQQVLASFQLDDLGRDHVMARDELIFQYILRGEWDKAEPHATAFAKTNTTRGLYLAGITCEALAQWDASEGWFRQLSQTFPRSEGFAWYLWCRRNGRGDVDAATELARQHFALSRNISSQTLMDEAIFCILDGDVDRGLMLLRRILATEMRLEAALLVASLSRDSPDQHLFNETLNELEKAIVLRTAFGEPTDRQRDVAGRATIDLLRSRDVSQTRLSKLEQQLRDLPERDRSVLAYFLGQELDRRSKGAEAELYWRHSLVTPGGHRHFRTLAGAELARRRGTSRPDEDVLNQEDLWPGISADGSSP
jgi:tetratricopeptide (TPR) repeat protein